MVAKVIFGLVVVAAGWVWVGAAVDALGHDRALREWPRVEGRLVGWDGRGVKYVYEVGGKGYEATTLRLGARVSVGPFSMSNDPMSGSERSAAVARVMGITGGEGDGTGQQGGEGTPTPRNATRRKQAIGGSVEVWYDPATPGEAFIDAYRPRAPFLLMVISGAVAAMLAATFVGVRAGEGDVAEEVGDGWVRVPPLTSMRAMALATGVGAVLGLALVAGPGVYCVANGEAEVFWIPLGALALLGLTAWGAVYNVWRWKRVAYADVAIKGGAMRGDGLAAMPGAERGGIGPGENGAGEFGTGEIRTGEIGGGGRGMGGRVAGRPGVGDEDEAVWVRLGVPFAVRLEVRVKSGVVEGGEVELRREEKVTRGSGKDRRTTWETRERWKAPLEDGPTGGFLNEVRGDAVKATVMLTVPYGSPESSTGHRYRMRASVRISGGPDYAEEFAVGVG